jgi:hypothetical protein
MRKRKHHCRSCGQVCCDECTKTKRALPELDYTEPCRVCNECEKYLKDSKDPPLRSVAFLTSKDEAKKLEVTRRLADQATAQGCVFNEPANCKPLLEAVQAQLTGTAGTAAELRVQLVRLIANLSTNTYPAADGSEIPNRRLIGESGFISLLLGMLCEPAPADATSAALHLHVARALVNLIRHKPNLELFDAEVRRDGATAAEAIFDMISDSAEGAQEWLAMLVCETAKSKPALQQKYRDAHAMFILSAVVSSPHAGVQEQALNAILALCNSPTVLAEVAADDDMRTAAFRALASPLTPAVADVAVQLCSKLVAVPVVQASIGFDEISAIITSIRNSVVTRAPVEATVKMLVSIMNSPSSDVQKVRLLVENADGIEPLLMLLFNDSVAVRTGVLSIILALSAESSVVPTLVAHGLVAPLVGVLNRCAAGII